MLFILFIIILTYQILDGVPLKIPQTNSSNVHLFSNEIYQICDIPPSKWLDLSRIVPRTTKRPLLKCHQHHSAHSHGKLQSHLLRQIKEWNPWLKVMKRTDHMVSRVKC